VTTKKATNSLVLDVPEAGRMLNLSRATAYSLAAKGVIPIIRFGKRIVVPRKALEELLGSVSKPKLN
jgi:excisionase family DNA binding protein